ncbi:hypothetical protein DN068_01045 [Taibaiella soli]|uniref:Uncharacterized protein n=2 Tax=Taibaiella soli TaxID=1649169 RepID=A0A2W2B3E7_9BACT|nr:hypothetical protein DN068_01045 [Taibaiella soli]
MKFVDQEDYSENVSWNIDIEFWAVSYIDTAHVLPGLIMSEITGTILPQRIRQKTTTGQKVYEIESGGVKYYIIAGGVLVGENKWENEDRIFNYSMNLKHDNILAIG